MISVKSVCKAFGDRQVLKDVSFELRENETVGLYGESGCGKSTLARILCGVEKPDDGELYIDGKPVFSKTQKYDRAVGKQIQLVCQQPFSALDPSQKIGPALCEIADYNKLAATRAERRASVDNAVAEMGLHRDILRLTPTEISGGEAQRVALAKCMLLRPKLLILDEATSMLDVATQAEVLAAVKRIDRNYDLSTLFISHDEELVRFFCDRILYFENQCFAEMKK